MSTEPTRATSRFAFGLRTLMFFTFLIAGALAAWQYRTKALKPDLRVTADDLAWATDNYIWKFDLSEVGPVYGIRLVVLENGGEKKSRVCQYGGETLLQPSELSVVTISAKCDEGSVFGKMRLRGQTMSFNAKNILKGHTLGIYHRPKLSGDVEYLISDASIGGGPKLEEGANALALELLRSPTKR